MPQTDKSPITAFIGAFIGLVAVGSINPNYSLLGAIIGGIIGYLFGKS